MTSSPGTSPAPRVSVVVPVRDGAATLKAALTSALEQTIDDLEVLVVDDGSTDGSGELAEAVGSSRLRVLRQEPSGVARGRNRGARESRGAHLAFLDADDLWDSRKLEHQLAALERRPRAAAAYCWTVYIDASGRRVGRADRVRHEGDVYRRLLRRNFLESASNLLVTRAAFDAVGGFDPAYSGAADWDLALRLARRHELACARRVGVYYRVGVGGMSADLEAQERECRRLLDRELRRTGAEASALARQSRAQLDHYLAFKALEDADRRRGVRRARAYFRRALRSDPLLPLRRPRLTWHLARQLHASAPSS